MRKPSLLLHPFPSHLWQKPCINAVQHPASVVVYHPQSMCSSPVQHKLSQLVLFHPHSSNMSPVYYNPFPVVPYHPQSFSNSPVKFKSHPQWSLPAQQTPRLRWHHRPLSRVKVRIVDNNWDFNSTLLAKKFGRSENKTSKILKLPKYSQSIAVLPMLLVYCPATKSWTRHGEPGWVTVMSGFMAQTLVKKPLEIRNGLIKFVLFSRRCISLKKKTSG